MAIINKKSASIILALTLLFSAVFSLPVNAENPYARFAKVTSTRIKGDYVKVKWKKKTCKEMKGYYVQVVVNYKNGCWGSGWAWVGKKTRSATVRIKPGYKQKKGKIKSIRTVTVCAQSWKATGGTT